MNTKFRLKILKGGDHLEDIGADGRIILKQTGGCGLVSSGSG
jgi:hypothetical protein